MNSYNMLRPVAFQRASGWNPAPSKSFVTFQQSQFPQNGAVRHAANIKELKTRMKSVKSVQKITKTMKMIASSRLKAAESKMQVVLPFIDSLQKLMTQMDKLDDSLDKTAEKGQKHLLVPITTDKGLCGAINAYVTKYVKQAVKGTNTSIAIVGEKGVGQLSREQGKRVLVSAHETSAKTSFGAAVGITEAILPLDFEKVSIIFNKYRSIIAYDTTATTIPSFEAISAALGKGYSGLDAYEFEDDMKENHMRDLFEFTLGALVYASMIENQAVELAARMTSMDNASTNAGEVLKKLNLKYNRQRQTAITTELIEIISGASALE